MLILLEFLAWMAVAILLVSAPLILYFLVEAVREIYKEAKRGKR